MEGVPANEENFQVVAIDRQFWVGKTSVRIHDIEKAHQDLVRLEDGANRAIRHVHRRTTANLQAINRVSGDVNTNLATLEAQIVSLCDRVIALEEVPHGSEFGDGDGGAANQNINPNPAGNGDNLALIVVGPFADQNPVELGEINTLTSVAGFETFGDESVISFDKWALKFKDYVKAMGATWTPEQQVDRLRLTLVDTPRELFEQLTPNEASSVDSALKAVRDKLDSPQRREIAKRNLTICRQREDESVGSFLKRLTPMVEVVNANLGKKQLRERLVEEFLDRLKPNISFLVRVAGLAKEKDLDLVKAQAEELEALLATQKGGNRQWFGGNQPPQNDRRWSSRTFCNFCKRVGHVAYNCRDRRRWHDGQNQPVNAVQPVHAPSTSGSMLTIDANELIRAMANLSMKPSGSQSRNDSGTMNVLTAVTKNDEAKDTNKPESNLKDENFEKEPKPAPAIQQKQKGRKKQVKDIQHKATRE